VTFAYYLSLVTPSKAICGANLNLDKVLFRWGYHW